LDMFDLHKGLTKKVKELMEKDALIQHMKKAYEADLKKIKEEMTGSVVRKVVKKCKSVISTAFMTVDEG